MEWIRTFDFTASADAVWAALTMPDSPTSWDSDRVRQASDGDRSATWTDTHDDIDIEMTMRLEVTETESGARVTLTRSGFGEGDMFDIRQTSKLVAWAEVMHDLAVYLDTGIDLRRLYRSHPDHPLSATGLQLEEVLGGMRVTDRQPGSFGEHAGLEVGDLVVGLAGVPVFDRTDMWLLTRSIAPETDTEVRYIRGRELLTASAPMSPIDLWATGELGGGPRE